MTTAEEAAIALGSEQAVPATNSTEAAFEAWMTARQGALLRTAYLVCGDAHTAEDLVATALAKVYLRWGRLRDPAKVDAYARRIVVNENASLWRRAWRRREVVSERLPETAGPGGADDGSRDATWRALATLPPRQRAVVVLRYYEDLTEVETAAVLRVSVGTVKSQHHHALAKLRALVGELTGEEDR